MRAGASFLDETLGAWRDVRSGLIAELETIPAGQMGFRPTPDVRSVRELVQHILEVACMTAGELGRPDTDFRRLPWPELLEMHAGHVARAKNRKGLVALLHDQMTDAEQQLRRVGPLGFQQFITNFDGSQWTKMQWLHHAIAHEMYHRGQLTLYIRHLGGVPALTQRMSA
jgi:uncharacterized damage-inducible protein DinB